MRLLIMALSLSFLMTCYATWFTSEIKAIHTTTDGRVSFRLMASNADVTCDKKDQWEILPESASFKENYSMLLSAYHAKTPISINYSVTCSSAGKGIVTQMMLGDWFK